MMSPHRPPINNPSILLGIQFVIHNYIVQPVLPFIKTETITLTITPKMSMVTTKATMTELKLRRLMEHNHRLREELTRPRVTISVASMK